MATRSKDASGSAADHQRDLYSWLVEQARLVRDGRWQAVDQDNLAREIEGLAQQQFDKLEGALHALLTHLLIVPRILEAIAHCYREARAEAANDAGLDENSFPAKCPYDWDEIIAREFAA
jgi:hypothetical protein